MQLVKKTYYSKEVRHKMIRDFLVIFYLVGIIGLNLQSTKPLFLKLIPFTILLSFLALMVFHRHWSRRFIVVSLFIAVSSYLIEAAGVHTKIIFGEYFYGPNLGVKVWETPLLIGINWLMLTYIGYVIFLDFNWPVMLKVLAGAIVLVIYDFFMEPMAIRLDMWDWAGSTVPLKNYLAWFILSFFYISLFYLFKIKAKNKLALVIFFIQLVFFVVLNIIFLIKTNFIT